MKPEDIAGGLLVIAAGITVISARQKFVESIVKLNNSGLGFYKYGATETKGGQWLVIILGCIFIIIGFLIMIGKFWTN